MKNGWYVFKPKKKLAKNCVNDYWRPIMTCGKQVVQVIENEVWVTGVTNTYKVRLAEKHGKFKRRIKI